MKIELKNKEEEFLLLKGMFIELQVGELIQYNLKAPKKVIIPKNTYHKFICKKIIDAMININELKMLKFRDLLYDIFIYNLNITDCIWYILTSLNEQNKISKKDLSLILVKTFSFFQEQKRLMNIMIKSI